MNGRLSILCGPDSGRRYIIMIRNRQGDTAETSESSNKGSVPDLIGSAETGSTPCEPPVMPPVQNKRMKTSGSCSAIRNNATAGPLGLRLPCSQS